MEIFIILGLVALLVFIVYPLVNKSNQGHESFTLEGDMLDGVVLINFRYTNFPGDRNHLHFTLKGAGHYSIKFKNHKKAWFKPADVEIDVTNTPCHLEIPARRLPEKLSVYIEYNGKTDKIDWEEIEKQNAQGKDTE